MLLTLLQLEAVQSTAFKASGHPGVCDVYCSEQVSLPRTNSKPEIHAAQAIMLCKAAVMGDMATFTQILAAEDSAYTKKP